MQTSQTDLQDTSHPNSLFSSFYPKGAWQESYNSGFLTSNQQIWLLVYFFLISFVGLYFDKMRDTGIGDNVKELLLDIEWLLLI